MASWGRYSLTAVISFPASYKCSNWLDVLQNGQVVHVCALRI